MDCPDAEALAAFKHSVRDEWLARHLGQEKPKTMAALTTLMTRFCAGEDSWLARRSKSPATPTLLRPEMAMVNHAAIKTNVRAIMMMQMIQPSMPDSVVLNLVSGRNLSKATGTVHPVWTKSLRGPVRFMAHPISLLTTPTGTVGSSNMPVR